MNEEKIIDMLLKHEGDIEWVKEHMSTKSDHREVMDALDTLVKLAKKKDEELTFMGERVSRIERDVQQLKPANGVV